MAAWQIPLSVKPPEIESPLVQQQRALSLKQLAGQVAMQPGQLAIQRQIQAENALKIQAMNEDHADDQAFQKAYTANVLKAQQTSAPKIPSAETQSENQDTGTAGDAGTAAPQSPAPVDQQAIWDQTLDQLRGQLKVRNAVKYQNEQLAARRAALSMTQDERQMHKDAADTIGSILFGAYQAEDPDQKQGLWEAALRQAKKSGIDVSAYPQKVPEQNTLAGFVAANQHGKDVIDWANKEEQANLRKEQAQQRKDQDARQQFIADKQDAAARLAQAPDGPSYAQILSTLDPKVASSFPSAPVGEITDDFKNSVLEGGMTAEQRLKNRDERQKLAEQAKRDAQVKYGPDITSALLATGAKDVSNPTQGEMLRARNFDTEQKVKARPVNQFTPPPTAPTAPGEAPKPTTIDQVPEALRGTVQRIINGDSKLPALGRNNPTNQAISYWVSKVDPTYTDSRADLKKSFISGKDADNVKSLNTVIGHLGSLADNAGKLDNTTFRKFNNFGNWLSRETSTDVTAPFRVDRRGVASELATALKGGMANEAEVQGWLNDIDSADSPGTLKSTIGEISNIIGSRMDALEQKRSELPEASRPKPLLSEKSKQVLSRLSGTKTPAAVPPAVKSLLSNPSVAPGIHKLSDGTIWMKDANGNITAQ